MVTIKKGGRQTKQGANRASGAPFPGLALKAKKRGGQRGKRVWAFLSRLLKKAEKIKKILVFLFEG
jgi:hypothetical protein